MKAHSAELVFYFLITLAVILLSYFIFAPYLAVLFLSIIFAIVFFPLYKWLLKGLNKNTNLSALVAVLLIVIVILLPLFLIGVLLFQESTAIYGTYVAGGLGLEIIQNGLEVVDGYLNNIPGVSLDISQFAPQEETLKGILSWVINNLTALFSGVVKGVLFLFLFVLSLFYLFRDGKQLVEYLVRLSPLADAHDIKIVKRLTGSVNSVVRGYIVIAVIKAILASIGFAIFGVGSPVLWGLLTAIASLVPTVGTAIVMIPAVLFLFFTGPIGPAIGLLIWAIVIVGAVDNFLAPYLIQKGVNVHPLLILLSVLGGIALFGPVGFIVGPVVLSLLFALLDMYPLLIGIPRNL